MRYFLSPSTYHRTIIASHITLAYYQFRVTVDVAIIFVAQIITIRIFMWFKSKGTNKTDAKRSMNPTIFNFRKADAPPPMPTGVRLHVKKTKESGQSDYGFPMSPFMVTCYNGSPIPKNGQPSSFELTTHKFQVLLNTAELSVGPANMQI